jgi:peptidyl-prolyl cis-trans isomerase B (cyclophilin B)
MKTLWLIIILIAALAVIMLTTNIAQTDSVTPAGAGGSQLTLETNLGKITIELLTTDAPKTVANFKKLAASGFYNGTQFHRVIKGFMIQGGDPLTKSEPTNWSVHGTGGPGYTFADEPNNVKLVRGIVAMANAGPNTNGSQFFIITAPVTDWLQGKHTAFGRVIAGLDVVDKIEQVKVNENDHPLEAVRIERIDL